MKKLLSSRRERERAGLFAADGTKLLQEAARYCPGLETAILSDGVEAQLPEQVRMVCHTPEAANVYRQIWNMWFASTKAERMETVE